MELERLENNQEICDNFEAVLSFIAGAYDSLNMALYHLNELANLDPEDETYQKAITFIKQLMKEYKKMFDLDLDGDGLGWTVLEDPYIKHD